MTQPHRIGACLSSYFGITLLSFLICLSLSCTIVPTRPETTLDSKVAIAELDKTFNLAKNIKRYNTVGADEPAKQSARDNIIDGGIALIDQRYNVFVTEFTRARKGTNVLAEVGAISVNVAGALFTPASTVRILSGTAGGITASNASLKKNFFYDQSLLVLIRQMSASRRKAVVHLLMGRKLSTSSYSLADALSDLGRYYHAGTFEGSIAAITESAAETEKDAEAQIRDLRGITVSWKAWIKSNGRDKAVALILQKFNGLPQGSNILAEILATATAVAVTQYPPDVAFGASDPATAAANLVILNGIFAAQADQHRFSANPSRFAPYLEGHADPDALAQILGTESLGLLPPQ